MLWLTWRQHRLQLAVTAALLVLLWAFVVLDELPQDFVKALPWAPVLVGMFWGVPLLAREYEQHTQRVAWTQSVPRLRWLVVKFGVLAVAVTLAGLVLGAVMTDWTRTTGAAADRFSGDLFGITGVAPGAWFLVVFALGTASGAVLRRTLPAMAATIAVAAVLVIGALLLRGYYAEPVVAVQRGEGIAVPAGALLVDRGVRNTEGDRVSWDDAWGRCDPEEPVSCMRKRGYTEQWVSYQPADRYWRFQWTETGILLALTVLLAGVTTQRVLRRPL